MNGPGHRAFAACCWLLSANALVQPTPTMTVIAILPAVATSYGVASPDIDNTKTAKRLDKAMPDEALGGTGPLQHRGLAHWWGIPLVLFMLVKPIPGWPGVILMAMVVGWASHILADFFFGKAGYGTRIGIPLLPWGWNIGVGMKVGGPTEKSLVQFLRALAAVLTLLILGWVEALQVWWDDFFGTLMM